MSGNALTNGRNLCLAAFALFVLALIPDQLAAQRGGSDRGRGGSGSGFQGRGGSDRSPQGRGGSTQGRGGSPQGRGGSDRGSQGRGGSDRGSQGRGGGGGSSDFLRRMDTNGNGSLDPSEQGRLRPLLERISSARRDRGSSSLDLSRPIPISRLTEEFNRMQQQRREQGGSSRGSGGSSNLGRGDSGNLSRTELEPLVPDFAFEEEVYIPLPGFGPEGERNTVKVTEADRKEAAQTMKRYDKNGDNILSKEEISQARWRDDPLQQDRNRDGRLTINELSLRYALRRNDNTDSGNSNRSSNRSSSRDSSSRSSSSRDSGSSGRGSSTRGSSGRDSNSGRGSSSSSSSSGSSTDRMAFFANSLMQRYDENGSGVLEKSEWKSFRTDPSAADTNKDGKITKDELTKWMGNRMSQRGGGDSGRGGRGDSGGDSGRSRGRGDSGGDSGRSRGRGDSGGDSSRGRGRGDSGGRSRNSSSGNTTPESYTFKTLNERLPDGLPEWFKANDADADGQIMMAEYSKTWDAKMLDSFDKFDFNADGVITPEECLDAIDDGVTFSGQSGGRSTRESSSSDNRDSGRRDSRSGDSRSGDDDQKSSSSKTASSATGSSRAARYASSTMKSLDANKDGLLEEAEWSKSRYVKKNFDTDGDGKLSLEELTKGFGG